MGVDKPAGMQQATYEAAQAIAAFLRDKQGTMRIGSIAALEGCPIRPPMEGADGWPPRSQHIVGAEPHCQRVRAALEAAVRLGLVTKIRRGTTGPWFYTAVAQ